MTTKNSKERLFTIVGEEYVNISFLLGPPGMGERLFLIKDQNGVVGKIVIGIHKIGNVAKEIIMYYKFTEPE